MSDIANMTSALARRVSHTDVLKFSQNAPQYLQKQANIRTSTLLPFLSVTESSDVWMSYEQLLLSCLRTGDDKSALLCLDSLISRFGADNERIMALRGLYQEAIAADEIALDKVLQEYEHIILEDPTNIVWILCWPQSSQSNIG